MGWGGRGGPGGPGGPGGGGGGGGGRGPGGGPGGHGIGHNHRGNHNYNHNYNNYGWYGNRGWGWGWGSGLGFWGGWGWGGGWGLGLGWGGGWGGGWGWPYAYSSWGWGAPLGWYGSYYPYGTLGWNWGSNWYGSSAWYASPCWTNTAWVPSYCGLGLGSVGLGWFHCGWPWLCTYGLNSWGWNSWSAPAGPVLYSPGYVYDYNPDQNTMTYLTDSTPLPLTGSRTVVTDPRLVELEGEQRSETTQGTPTTPLSPIVPSAPETVAAPADNAGLTPPDEGDRESSLVFAERGETDFRNGDYKSAVYSWKHALVDDPENGVLVMMLAQGLLATGEFPQSAGAVQQGLQMLPQEKWGVVIENFRELYGQRADYTTHIRALEKAIREKPDDPALRFLAGYHYLYLGYPKQAMDQLDKGLKSAPRDQVAKKLRAYAEARQKEAEAKGQPAAATPATPATPAAPATPTTPPLPPPPPPPPPGDAGQ